MVTVDFVFGRKAPQDLDEYTSGSCDPLVFTVTTDTVPSTWESAYSLLGFFRADFIKACVEERTSSALYTLFEGRDSWIPSCYLDRPTIEVSHPSRGSFELLLQGERPNPWLSRNIH